MGRAGFEPATTGVAAPPSATPENNGIPPPPSDTKMEEIMFEDVYIRFPRGNVEAAETAKELIEMKIKKLKKPASKDLIPPKTPDSEV